jgi:hypothetical protein
LPLAVELGGEKRDPCRIAAGLGERAHEPLPNHVVGQGEDWNPARRLLRRANGGVAAGQDDIDVGFRQFGRMLVHLVDAQAVSALVHHEVLPVYEAQAPQLAQKRNMKGGVAWTGEHRTEPINPPGLLRARGERPRGRRAAEQGDEIAAFHSITSSAMASSVGGTAGRRAALEGVGERQVEA